MVDFRGAYKCLQLAFSSEEDTFYLPSLVRTDLKHYLLYCLKASGCQAVLFWDQEKEGLWEISFLDRDSAKYCYENNKANFFSLRLPGIKPADPFSPILFTETEKLRKSFLRMLEWDHAAIVIPIDVFATFFRSFDADSIRKALQNGNSLILLTAPACAEGSNLYLTDPQGILQCLSSGIRSAAETSGHLYRALKTELGSGCHFLSGMEEAAVHSLLTRYYLIEAEKETLDPETIKKMALTLVYLARSQAFRKQTASFHLPTPCSIRQVTQLLADRERLQPLLSWLRNYCGESSYPEFRASLSAYPLEDGCCIYVDSPLLRKWDQQTGSDRTHFLYQKLETALLRGIPSQELPVFTTCMDRLGDSCTRDTALSALEYLLDTLTDPPSIRPLIQKSYLTLFDCQTSLLRQEAILEDMKKLKSSEVSFLQARMTEDMLRSQIQKLTDNINLAKTNAITAEAMKSLENLSNFSPPEITLPTPEETVASVEDVDLSHFSFGAKPEVTRKLILNQ